jgi:hypothetical protein
MSCERLFTKEPYVYSTPINIGPRIGGYSTDFMRGQIRLAQHETHTLMVHNQINSFLLKPLPNPLSAFLYKSEKLLFGGGAAWGRS